MTIPAGYRLHTYFPSGYIIAGSITFGVSYLLGIGAATSAKGNDFNANWMILPVVGPFIAMSTQHDVCLSGETPPACHRHPATTVVLAILGGMQAVGATLFTYGMTHPRQHLVRVERPQMTVAPVPMGSAGFGLAAAGTF